ncbi:LysR family transcriptional regulator [Polaromonas sp. SM01]|uniref:LysR family transcriptional regulator n=1 Tax=Polaromonas sp. SM01 TaxID=3085630 RepID=UPI0029817930|nr:LysR family transcriptional regulator [Polaromonas sp. SM01]MDW5444639.1 LysR substrate-binding domain-containing protein [Polaromonas sp. SM01]
MTNAVFFLFNAFKALGMNVSWLEDFLVLATTGNFSRAADERHMTQPAFGRRVRALEEWIGTELFDRRSQPVRLTEAGQWFHGVAHDLLAQVARVPGEARAVAEASSNSLRFAATHALSFTFMPGWLRSFEAHTMAGTIQLESDVLLRCEALMEQSKVQFVVCHAHPQAVGRLQADAYPSVKIGADVLVPVTAVDSDGHPIHTLQAGKTAVPLLSYSAESGLGRLLRETRLDALENVSTQTVFTAHLASVLRTMVLDGRGLAWLPQTLIQDDLASHRVAQAGVGDLCIELEIRLFRSRNSMGRAAEALWDAIVGAGVAVG